TLPADETHRERPSSLLAVARDSHPVFHVRQRSGFEGIRRRPLPVSGFSVHSHDEVPQSAVPRTRPSRGSSQLRQRPTAKDTIKGLALIFSRYYSCMSDVETLFQINAEIRDDPNRPSLTREVNVNDVVDVEIALYEADALVDTYMRRATRFSRYLRLPGDV